MKDKRKDLDDINLDLQDDLTTDFVESLARNIQLIPDAPSPRGFVEAAMASWRKSQRVLPSPASPISLTLLRKTQIIFSQGLWRDVVLGMLLLVLGYFVISRSEMLPPMLILPVVGCIPLLVVISSTARHMLCGMGELTRSLCIPLHWYVQARLLLVGVVSFLLNGIIMIAVIPVWDGDVLPRVALLWCIPTLINAAVALFLSARIRNFGQLAAVLALLPIFWLFLFSNESAVTWTDSVALVWLWGLAVMATALICGVLINNRRYLKKGGFLIGA